MRWTTENIAKVSEALKLAGFPGIHEIVIRSEVASMADIKAHLTAARTARDAAGGIANTYGKAAIEYWESITAEELSERLACIYPNSTTNALGLKLAPLETNKKGEGEGKMKTQMNINAIPKFEKGFASYVCEGDYISVEVGDITYTARIVRDLYSHIDDEDCHNTDQAITGCTNEEQAKLLAARKAWFEDVWFYGGIVIDAERNGWKKERLSSLWRIECNYPGSDNGYLLDVANDLLEEAVDNI